MQNLCRTAVRKDRQDRNSTQTHHLVTETKPTISFSRKHFWGSISLSSFGWTSWLGKSNPYDFLYIPPFFASSGYNAQHKPRRQGCPNEHPPHTRIVLCQLVHVPCSRSVGQASFRCFSGLFSWQKRNSLTTLSIDPLLGWDLWELSPLPITPEKKTLKSDCKPTSPWCPCWNCQCWSFFSSRAPALKFVRLNHLNRNVAKKVVFVHKQALSWRTTDIKGRCLGNWQT